MAAKKHRTLSNERKLYSEEFKREAVQTLPTLLSVAETQ